LRQAYKEIARLLEVKGPVPVKQDVDESAGGSLAEGASRLGFWQEFMESLEMSCMEENRDIMEFLREENAAAFPVDDDASVAVGGGVAEAAAGIPPTTESKVR
jgi:hypothetical protein